MQQQRAKSAQVLSHLSKIMPSQLHDLQTLTSSQIFNQVVTSTPKLSIPYRPLRQVEIRQTYQTQNNEEQKYLTKRNMRCVSARVYPKFPPSVPRTPTLQQFQRPRTARPRQKANEIGNQTDFEPQIIVKEIHGVVEENHSITRVEIQKGSRQLPRQIHSQFQGKVIQGIWHVNDSDHQEEDENLKQDLNISVVKKARFTPINFNNVPNFVNFASQIVKSSGITPINEDLQDVRNFRTGRFRNLTKQDFEDQQTQSLQQPTQPSIPRSSPQQTSQNITLQKLILSAANQTSSLILSKFITTNQDSLIQGTLQIASIYQQYLDIIIYNDFGKTPCAPFHDKLITNSTHYGTIVEIFNSLNSKMLLGSIQKKLVYIDNIKFDIFDFAFNCSVQTLFTKLQFSDNSIKNFAAFSFQKIFQLLYLISIQKQFFTINQLQQRSYLFYTIASSSVICYETFNQAEFQSSQYFQFSKQILNFAILYSSNVLAQIYQNYNMKNTEQIKGNDFEIFDENIQGMLQQTQELKNTSTVFEIIFENQAGYNFKKSFYVKANEFLTYSSVEMDCYVFEAVYIYFYHHFDKFFSTELTEISKYVAYQLIPRIQLLTFLSVQYLKSLCLSQSTCNVVASAFQGVIPQNVQLFLYTYQLVTYFFKCLIDDNFLALLLQSTKKNEQSFVLAKHAEFCSQILNEILMINYMIVGNDISYSYKYNGEASKMIQIVSNSYNKNHPVDPDQLFQVAKNFVYQEVERIYIGCDECQLLRDKLITVLVESDVVVDKLFLISKNIKFLEIVKKLQQTKTKSELFK